MTRFARSKGSKASNEKLPERATSWSEMKEELLNKNKELAEQKNREAALKQRQANYQAFLQEREEEEDKKIAWADFPESTFSGNNKKRPQKRKFKDDGNGSSSIKACKKADLIQSKGEYESEDSDGEFSALKSEIEKVLAKQSENDSDSDDAPPEEVSIKEKPQEIVIKKAKKPKQKLKIVLAKEEQLSKTPEASIEKNNRQKSIKEDNAKEKTLTEKDKTLIAKKFDRERKQREKKKLKRQEQREKKNSECPGLPEEKLDDLEMSRIQKKLERRKKQKEKKKLKQESGVNNFTEKKAKSEENLSESDLKKIEKKKERRVRQAEKRQKLREAKALAAEGNKGVEGSKDQAQKISRYESNFKETNDNNGSKKFNQQEQNGDFRERKPVQRLLNNQKKAKPRDNREHPSRKQKPEKMFINGKTIEIDYIEGFPVKKEDADRLKKLRKEMISKGLPRSEINAALKLERRRAEKAFAREKKNVCFNCRKSGHNLSECPDLDKDQVAQSAGTGICFKCGSTEHTHFECKVVRGLDYKFATCFICKEQGHIARQCPDNQRGLYPKGGCCKVCGDVTHLKKDCPKYQAQQSHMQNSLSIGTLDNGNPDDLGAKGANNSFGDVRKSLNKIVKF